MNSRTPLFRISRVCKTVSVQSSINPLLVMVLVIIYLHFMLLAHTCTTIFQLFIISRLRIRLLPHLRPASSSNSLQAVSWPVPWQARVRQRVGVRPASSRPTTCSCRAKAIKGHPCMAWSDPDCRSMLSKSNQLRM